MDGYIRGLTSGAPISRDLYPGVLYPGVASEGGGGLHPEVYFKGVYTSVLYPGGL